MKQKWVLASGNRGKIAEISELIKPYNIKILPQSEFNISDIPETGLTFVENALLKARHACLNSRLPCIADDSGIIVPSLNGEPGIYSARYAGTGSSEDNINKLINNLKKLPEDKYEDKYTAYFYCVIVFLQHHLDPTPIIAQGSWHGKIILKPRGTNGFGYDPVFFDPELNLTAAELPSEIKQKRSHRGQALRQLSQLLDLD